MNPEIVERIKTAFERNGRAIELRPAVGQKTAIMKTRVIDGLHVETEEGRWKLACDASDKSGGTGAAPDPGFVVRAALGNCFAMGYVIWAAHLGVPIEDVEVEMHADFDARGQHGSDTSTDRQHGGQQAVARDAGTEHGRENRDEHAGNAHHVPAAGGLLGGESAKAQDEEQSGRDVSDGDQGFGKQHSPRRWKVMCQPLSGAETS